MITCFREHRHRHAPPPLELTKVEDILKRLTIPQRKTCTINLVQTFIWKETSHSNTPSAPAVGRQVSHIQDRTDGVGTAFAHLSNGLPPLHTNKRR